MTPIVQRSGAQQALPSYLPELDGFRAIAIISVILCHRIPGSGLLGDGVYLFFVLSGFLITGILLDTRDAQHYFRNFYTRRALRIFPIYYLTLAVVIAFAIYRKVSVADWYCYLVYLQNYVIDFGRTGSRFPSEFTHTWSLAVEEQFYLIWPLLVYFLRRQTLAILCLLLLVVGPISRLAIEHFTHDIYFASYILSSNADSLAAGAFGALLLRSERFNYWRLRGNRPVQTGLWLCCLFWTALVLLSYLWHRSITYSFSWTRWSGNLLLTWENAAFLTAIVAAVTGKGPISKILRNRVLRHIGKISYGIYLYHLPVFELMPHVLHKLGVTIPRDSALLAVADLVTTYLIALLSWRLVESPILSLKEKFAPRARPDATSALIPAAGDSRVAAASSITPA